MRIQVALDDITIEDGISLCNEIIDYIDIIEVGTPMIIEYGVEAIRQIRQAFPSVIITADPKIMDAGYYESRQCFAAGANIVTVMGVTHNETFEDAVKAAEEYDGEIMADMMCVSNPKERGAELLELGVSYITIHAAVDVQNKTNPYSTMDLLAESISNEYIGVAGGINESTIMELQKTMPNIAIVGGGLTKADDPRATAERIKRIVSDMHE